MHRTHAVPLALAALAAGLVAGCAAAGDGRAADTSESLSGTASVVSTAPSVASAPPTPSAPPAAVPAPPRPTTAAPSPTPSPTRQHRVAELAIPAIGVADLRVVPYEGTTDDRPGTRIQDRGDAASPYGERGGAGPGEVGNYLVTAHRLSAGGPLRDLPALKNGDTVVVTAGGTVYTYEIVGTRSTSFRDARSLAAQRAEVPGKPGEKATRAMITLSTCATPEDNAAGNFWRDAQGNPEHRIDKIGVLVSARPA